MMMDLFDEDRILEIHIASECRKIAEKEEKKAEKKERATIERMLRMGILSKDEIAESLDVSVDKVSDVEAAMLQSV